MPDYEVTHAFRVLERHDIDIYKLLKEVAEANPHYDQNNAFEKGGGRLVCFFCFEQKQKSAYGNIKHKETCLHYRIKSLFPNPHTPNPEPGA